MKISKDSKIILNNQTEMPLIGLGVYKIENQEELKSAVLSAFSFGYKMIDTASRYKNEEYVADAIDAFGFLREEVFITSKLWNTDQGYDNTLKAVDLSLKKLKTSYLDLYLIHFPSASEKPNESINKREETWRAMEKILDQGKAKAIGVSNYTINHLKEMKEYAYVMPAVNQIEFHPFLYQKDLIEFMRKENIALEAYSPLAKGKKFDNPSILKMAQKYQKSPAQIMLRWALQHNAIVIPKAIDENKIKENIDIFNFEIKPEDVFLLDNLNINFRTGWDPSVM